MKQEIHPKYYPNAQVICSCGNTWTTGATVEVIRTDVCSACHPFFTGEQRIVDTAGQVDRFQKRVKRFEQYKAQEKAREEASKREKQQTALKQQIEALDLSDRVHKALVEAGLVRVGDVLEKLEAGDSELLDVPGIGPKSLEEIKEQLQSLDLVPA